MLYTSYFSNIRHFPSTLRPIGICRFPPRWFTGINLRELAPTAEILVKHKNKELDDSGYILRYTNEVLSQVNPQEIYEKLLSHGTPDVALICYERPTDFCHRHIVAQWLERHMGVPIPEYQRSIVR